MATEAGDEPLDAGVRVLLARSSRRHGQHAQWWRAALPDSPALDGPSRVRPPSEAWAQLVNYVESAPAPEAVSVLHEVALPELAAALDWMAGELSPVSDGAVARVVRMVMADLHEEQAEIIKAISGSQVGVKAPVEGLLSRFTESWK